jgi:hypothetical protein
MFLNISPSFMITTKFFFDQLDVASGSPSTTSRSASAPSSITPSLPG